MTQTNSKLCCVHMYFTCSVCKLLCVVYCVALFFRESHAVYTSTRSSLSLIGIFMAIKSLYPKIDNYDCVGREQRSCMKILMCIINEMSTVRTIYSHIKLFSMVWACCSEGFYKVKSQHFTGN